MKKIDPYKQGNKPLILAKSVPYLFRSLEPGRQGGGMETSGSEPGTLLGRNLENGEHNGPSLVWYGYALVVMASGLLSERGSGVED